METGRKIRRRKIFEALETKPLIVRDEYDIAEASPEMNKVLNGMKKIIDKETAQAIAFKLRNNSAIASEDRLGNIRPVSAYYTILGQKLIIERGGIDPQGNAKLHDHLHRSVDYMDRVKKGGMIRSGHIGRINLPGIEKEIIVALFDSLDSAFPVNPQNPEYSMTTTLFRNGFLPVTSDGYPVEISK